MPQSPRPRYGHPLSCSWCRPVPRALRAHPEIDHADTTASRAALCSPSTALRCFGAWLLRRLLTGLAWSGAAPTRAATASSARHWRGARARNSLAGVRGKHLGFYRRRRRDSRSGDRCRNPTQAARLVPTLRRVMRSRAARATTLAFDAFNRLSSAFGMVLMMSGCCSAWRRSGWAGGGVRGAAGAPIEARRRKALTTVNKRADGMARIVLLQGHNPGGASKPGNSQALRPRARSQASTWPNASCCHCAGERSPRIEVCSTNLRTHIGP